MEDKSKEFTSNSSIDNSNNRNVSNSGNNDKDGPSNNGWFTGYIQGNTFHNKEVQYRIINGMAIFEGDIVLASTPKEIEKLSHKIVKGIGIKGEWFRWLRGEIPYTIDSGLPNPDRVYSAIRHWEKNT